MNKRSSWSLPYLIFMIIFVVLPLVLVLIYAFQDAQGHFSFVNITRFFSDADALSTFALSLEIAILNTLICLLLGYPAAWILANKKYNRSAVTVVLFILPMWINALMRTLATAELQHPQQNGSILCRGCGGFGCYSMEGILEGNRTALTPRRNQRSNDGLHAHGILLRHIRILDEQ